MTGRLLVDPPASGAWNMAVDEALIASAAEKGICSLRFYQWSEPTLSLGYFQAYDERRGHAASRDCPVVRRSSGGGAILHDHELTYCITAPVSHPLAANPRRLYSIVHEALIGALANWRISARRFGNAPDGGATRRENFEPFLCFARRTADDVVLESPAGLMQPPHGISQRDIAARQIPPDFELRGVAGAKICGSAQRRRQGAISQHGGLLLATSRHAPELPGLEQLTGVPLPVEELITNWTIHLEKATSVRFGPAARSEEDLASIRQLTIEKYSTDAWTRRR